MAGVCCKSTAPFSVFKRTLSVRGSASAPRPPTLAVGGRRGVQEGCLVARPQHLRLVGPHRHAACLLFYCQESMSETLRTCYVYLNQTSRSFAAVIQALDGELR